jgi:hypothetical protein
LTKFHFVQYFLIENSYKLNLGVFNYKYLEKVKSPNFAYMCTPCSVAYEKLIIFNSRSK